MFGFIHSFSPILKRLRKFRLEIAILLIALVIAIISLILYIQNNENPIESTEYANNINNGEEFSHIIVDIAGAVEHPGVYTSTAGARLKDIILLAGGLSLDAEQEYISRNFNLAKRIVDQEKIYIPSHSEIINGIFTEPQRFLDYTLPAQTAINSVIDQSAEKIDINTATVEELDTLAGVGKVTADKIIQNRPYKSIQDLLDKKIVKKNIYENIKNLIRI